MRFILFALLLGTAIFFAPFLFVFLFLFFIFRGRRLRRRFYYRSEIIAIDGSYQRSNVPPRYIPIH